MPKISVIVPIYNSEKYIQRCLDSILAQKYTDFELLLINDGSTDSSGKICDDYARTDSRIKVFHKENGGVSSARNVGLENIHGEWICFVDSDDWVSENYLYNLISIVHDQVDLVISFAHFVNHPNPERFSYSDSIIKANQIDSLFSNYDLSWRTSPWAKLFRSSIVQDYRMRFVDGMHIGEDAQFLYNYISCCENEIRISSKQDYYYLYDNAGSLTKRINSLNSELKTQKEISKVVSSLINVKCIKDEVALKELDWLQASYINRVVNSLYANPVSIGERIRVLRSLDITLYNKFLTSTNSIYLHLQAFLLRNRMLWIYDMMRKMINVVKSLNSKLSDIN